MKKKKKKIVFKKRKRMQMHIHCEYAIHFERFLTYFSLFNRKKKDGVTFYTRVLYM